MEHAALTPDLFFDLIDSSLSAIDICTAHELSFDQLEAVVASPDFTRASGRLKFVEQTRCQATDTLRRTAALRILEEIAAQQPTCPTHAETIRLAAAQILRVTHPDLDPNLNPNLDPDHDPDHAPNPEPDHGATHHPVSQPSHSQTNNRLSATTNASPPCPAQAASRAPAQPPSPPPIQLNPVMPPSPRTPAAILHAAAGTLATILAPIPPPPQA